MSAVAPSSPYKGLSPFGDSELDALLFFGRERDQEIVVANLIASRLTVLYGPSGVGKSSLLQAGVARTLRELPERPLVVVFSSWGDDPAEALARDLAHAAGVEAGTLLDTIRSAEALHGDVYLVLDQAEEYFLYHPEGSAFEDGLAAVLSEPLRANVLLSLREDALAKLDRFKGRIPNILGNYLRLDRLDRRAGQAAIVRPVERFHALGGAAVEVEPVLVDAVLGQVAAGRIQHGFGGQGEVDGGASGVRIEAPYLQLVMERLWDVERAEHSPRLRLATLERLGGSEQIVAEHLALALASLTPRQQDIAAALFNHLVTPSGAKIAHDVHDLAEYAAVDEAEALPVLESLAANRILRTVAEDSDVAAGYEIFHDVLAGVVLAWRTQHMAERALERERTTSHRRHRRLALVALLALIALAGTLALATWALAQRAQARDQARLAEARELMASALSQLATDPERSLRLALQATELEASERTEDVLRRALLDSRLRLRANVANPVDALATGAGGVIAAASAKTVTLLNGNLVQTANRPFSGRLFELGGDGAVVVSGRTISILDPRTGQIERRLQIPEHELPVRDVESGKPLPSIAAPTSVRYAALGPERTLLAISDGSRRTVIVNAVNGEGRHVLEQPSAVTALRFGPAARTLAVGGSDGSIRLWRVSTGKHRATLRFGHVGHVTDIAFSPRATLLATASTDGTARVWRVGSAQPVSVLPGHENFVNDVEFSANGSFVVTAGKDGTARVWRAENGESIAVLRGHGDSVSAAAFLPGGRRVVTAGVEGTLRIWDSVKQPPLRLVRGFRVPVARVGFSGGGIEAVTADGRLHVLSTDGEELAQRDAGEPAVERSADGATMRIEGKTAVVRRADGRELVLRGHRDIVTSAHFSPDGAYVVTASRDHDPIVWDARRGVAVRKLLGHFAIVSDARFSPDGRWIVTAGPGKPGLWDASTGELIYLFQGHEGILLSAAFDSTSRRIVTGGSDGTVQTYRCTICGHADELIALARARLAAAAPR